MKGAQMMFMYYDKVDKNFVNNTQVIGDSERSVARGFIAWLKSDRTLNPKEFALYQIADFNAETGDITPNKREIDPNICYGKPADTEGQIVSN